MSDLYLLSPEISPHKIDDQFITKKPRGKRTISSINVVGKTGQPHTRE